jgi:NADH-quinone oxidoreductase subunit M
MQQYLISLLIFIPLAAAFIGLLLPAKSENSFRYLTSVANFFQLLILIFMFAAYDGSKALYFVEQQSWITLDLGTWGILKATYHVGVDGLSFPLVILSVFVMGIATISSWTINQNVKGILHTTVDSECLHHRKFHSP